MATEKNSIYLLSRFPWFYLSLYRDVVLKVFIAYKYYKIHDESAEYILVGHRIIRRVSDTL